ncbi:type III pantothenate kinase [Chitinivorax tropicus]|uniref:Type III pantothenate kinase n=1 Tax=Chitinivorax tropicus TaxID=714531 RepID=A0A840MSU1_9PROT|nr:type III pantothenate kinase [Chitinivorax tropicus]MBB5018281.1 type III pantothenate kinase [Chitinivorax tropicus]
MPHTPCHLLIDAGNTRVKWALHNGQNWLDRGHANLDALDGLHTAWSALPAIQRVVGSNVAGIAVKAQLETMLARHGLTIEWLTPSSQRLDVQNHYATPSQLGADRWAALLAARKLAGQHCLVVNLGTAMTVDALTASGQFLGGIIVPGFRLMQNALAQGTADLGRRQGHYQPFPTNTADAIHGGILQALLGAILRMQLEMDQADVAPACCVLSGGDGPLLQPHLSLPAILVDNLVLEGLLRIALE